MVELMFTSFTSTQPLTFAETLSLFGDDVVGSLSSGDRPNEDEDCRVGFHLSPILHKREMRCYGLT
jgi:hypothetical protein